MLLEQAPMPSAMTARAMIARYFMLVCVASFLCWLQGRGGCRAWRGCRKHLLENLRIPSPVLPAGLQCLKTNRHRRLWE